MAKFIITYANGRQFPIEISDTPQFGEFGTPEARAARLANELAQESGQEVQRVNYLSQAPVQPGSPITDQSVGNIISVGGQDFGTQLQNRSEEVAGKGEIFTQQTGQEDLNPLQMGGSVETESPKSLDDLRIERLDAETGYNKRLVSEYQDNFTTYRSYSYSDPESGREFVRFVIVAPGQEKNYSDRTSIYEIPISQNAFSNRVTWASIKPEDFFGSEIKNYRGEDLAQIKDPEDLVGFKDNTEGELNKAIYDNFKSTQNVNILNSIFQSLGRGFEFSDNSFASEDIVFDPSGSNRPDLIIKIGNEIAESSEKINEVADEIAANAGNFETTPLGEEGEALTSTYDPTNPMGIINTDPISLREGDTSFASTTGSGGQDFVTGVDLSDFFEQSNLNVTVPRDVAGNAMTITADMLPGFPMEILSPQNLFVQVEDRTFDFDEDTKETFEIVTRRTVANPQIEAMFRQYSEKLKALTGLQQSADDILQAQVEATGGLSGGPAGSLSLASLEELQRSQQAIASSGGLITSKRNVDGSFTEELTPLGQQRLNEESAARQQLLQQEALRQSGGLLGGFYSPLDAQGNPLEAGQQRFIGGLTPQQLLGRQEEEARRARQQELELARTQQAPTMFQNIADLYSNPAQLAAIVASGGSPLLRGQLPGSSFGNQTTGTISQNGMQQTSPFNITNPSGTVFDPNFVPVGGRTQEGDLRRQEANPFNVRDFSGVTEQRLRNLSDIELARAQGEAAAQGITPTSLEEIGTRNTPGGPLDKTRVLAPKTLFY